MPNAFERLRNISVVASDPLKIISKTDISKSSIKVVEVLPRIKEGGAFVKFTHEGNVTAEDIAKTVKGYLKKNPIRSWWSPLERTRANLVQGRPWVEDLYRMPSSRVKVEFLPTAPGGEAAELSQEQLYSFFRPYGKLADIIPQGPDSKVLPKFAYIDFAAVKRAIMAKNCMHGYLVAEAEGGGKAGTLLRLSYEKKAKAHWIRDWLFSHPRIVIPALAALVAGITVVVFDP